MTTNNAARFAAENQTNAPAAIYVVRVSYPLVPGDAEMFTHVYGTAHMNRADASDSVEWHRVNGNLPEGTEFEIIEYAPVPF